MNQSKNGLGNWLLLAGVAVLVILPLIIARNAEFAGADNQAKEVVTEIQPGYEPWFQPVVELPSAEVESFLFASQAALGAGVIGYVIGLYKGRNERQKNQHEHSD